MRGLFINLIAVNISEISDKTSSATFTKFFSSSEFTNKRKIYVVHRYARFKKTLSYPYLQGYETFLS